MKNSAVFIVFAALVGFSIGYYVKGVVGNEPYKSSANGTERPLERRTENSERPRAADSVISQVGATAPAERDSSPPSAAMTTSSTPRGLYENNKRKMLDDFFLINGIGAERAEQMVQGLVDADHYLAQKGNAMLNRRVEEHAESIARGDVVEITHSREEKRELDSERERLDKQIFGEYYEAYASYTRSYPQRQTINAFSSELSQPLDYASKENIVQIMYEESSRLKASTTRSSTLSGADVEGRSQHLAQLKEYNDKVLERVRTYMTPEQFDRFERRLNKEVRRFELLLELDELERGS